MLYLPTDERLLTPWLSIKSRKSKIAVPFVVVKFHLEESHIVSVDAEV